MSECDNGLMMARMISVGSLVSDAILCTLAWKDRILSSLKMFEGRKNEFRQKDHREKVRQEMNSPPFVLGLLLVTPPTEPSRGTVCRTKMERERTYQYRAGIAA